MQITHAIPVWTALAVALAWLPGCTSESGQDSAETQPAAVPPDAVPVANTDKPAAPPEVESGSVPGTQVASAGSTTDGPDSLTLPAPDSPPERPPIGLQLPDLGAPPAEEQPAATPEALASWMTDFEAAKARAQAEGKDILVDFTGSDWCTWCIRLDREVFSYQPFYEYTDGNFVLVKLDFPRGPGAISPEDLARNQAIKDHYGAVVEGFPTILLTDSGGRAYARTGFEFGGPTAYVAHLSDLKEIHTERDAAFTAADGLAGVEKAKKLEEGLLAMAPQLFFPSYETVITEIINLDADNGAGLNEKYTEQRQEFQFFQRISEIEAFANDGDLSETADEVLTRIDQVVTDFPDFKRGQDIIASFRVVVLRVAERHEEALKAADAVLAREDLPEQVRANVLDEKLRVLLPLKRTADAITTMDALVKVTVNPMEKAQMLVAKATWQLELKQMDAAKATFELARETGGPQVWDQIDAYEARKMAEATAPSPEAAPTPDEGSEETPKPATE